jgi:hypothetical protein
MSHLGEGPLSLLVISAVTLLIQCINLKIQKCQGIESNLELSEYEPDC